MFFGHVRMISSTWFIGLLDSRFQISKLVYIIVGIGDMVAIIDNHVEVAY